MGYEIADLGSGNWDVGFEIADCGFEKGMGKRKEWRSRIEDCGLIAAERNGLGGELKAEC